MSYWFVVGWMWAAFAGYYGLLAPVGIDTTVKLVASTALCLFCFAVHELLEVLRGRW